MKKLLLILVVAAFAASPLFVTEAQAGQALDKAHKTHTLHWAKHHHHHHVKHHIKHHRA